MKVIDLNYYPPKSLVPEPGDLCRKCGLIVGEHTPRTRIIERRPAGRHRVELIGWDCPRGVHQTRMAR